MSTLIHQYVNECRDGTNPRAICQVTSGWVVMGEAQFLSGYCLILPDPVVADLNQLNAAERQTLLHEMAVLGDALLVVTGAKRINYEILGNLEPALHVHVFPRFDSEPNEMKTRPVWFYDWKAEPQFDLDRDRAMMDRIRTYLQSAGVVV